MKNTPFKEILCSGALCMGVLIANGQNTFPASGNVGIGTSTPGYLFTVKNGTIGISKGNIQIWDDQYVPSNETGGDHGMIFIGKEGNTGFHWKLGELGDNDFHLTRWNNGTHAACMKVDDASGRISIMGKEWSAVDLGANVDDNVRLTVKGKVFIGDNATPEMQSSLKNTGTGSCPNLKLLVNGTIGATEVRVNSTKWCDHVFDTSYKLRPLNEVASFIQANKHLPEVPSEKEVIQNGVAVGEMMKIHMKKIEELTLYVIQLEKQNNQLRADLEKLKTK